MFSSIERIVTFAANLIAIVVFFGAMFGLVDRRFLPEITPYGASSAIAILILFAALVGFGSASVIKNRIDENAPYGFPVILYCLLFCVSTAYLDGILTRNLPANEAIKVYRGGMVVAGWLYPTIHFVVYLAKIWFPKGFGILQFFTSAFRSGYYIFMANLIFYGLTIPYLFIVLDDSFGR